MHLFSHKRHAIAIYYFLSHPFISPAASSYPPGQNPISYTVKLDSNGNRVGAPSVFGVSVDYRTRDYFLNSPLQPLGGVFWSALYTAQSYPVMTASVALRSNVTGELLGVNVVSQELGAVSHYMSAWDLRGGEIPSSWCLQEVMARGIALLD
jgi:hypothetical protein